MNKASKLIKRYIALLLVLLFSIESFAAVVGDNDGAAFITKAEFDSMKNDFQSQLDRYNSSLDNKIDGAIASYLAGVGLNKQYNLTNMLINAKKDNVANVGFAKWRAVDAGKDVVDLQAGLMLSMVYGASKTDNATSTSGLWCYNIMSNLAAWSGEFGWVRYAKLENSDPDAGDSAWWWAKFPFATNDQANYTAVGDTTNWCLAAHSRRRCHFSFKVEKVGFSAGRALGDVVTSLASVPWASYPTFFNDATTGPAAVQPGQWVADEMNLGITGINVKPNCALTHSWSVADSTDENKYEFLDYMLYGSISGTAVAVDYNFRDYYDISSPITVRCQSHKPEPTSTYAGYPGVYWGYMFGNTMIGKHPNAHNINDVNHNFWFKYNRQKKYTLNWVDLTNEYYDKVFADAYYKYQGIPICKVEKPGVVKFKLKFSNNKVSDGSNLLPSAAPYTYVIMDKRFKNGNLPTLTETDPYYRDTDGFNHVFKRETRNTGSSEWTTDWIEINKEKIIDSANGDYIYIKVAPNIDDQVVSVSAVDDIVFTES